MKKILYVLIFVTLMLSACVVASGPRGEVGVVIAPPLPMVVELEFPGAVYFHEDYYYQPRDQDWYYSRSKGGPWNHLPRDRYPREVRYKSRSHDGDDRRGHDGYRDKGNHDRGDGHDD